jgi:predicted transcriptional regulator
MLMHLLSQIANGNTLSHTELSRRLNISNELLEQMLLDLLRMGYIESVDDVCPTGRCTHCLFSGECASINKGKRWALTRKGTHAVARRKEGVKPLNPPPCS